MNNKLRFLLLPALILCVAANAAYAEETEEKAYGWSAVLKKAGLELTSTEVKNSSGKTIYSLNTVKPNYARKKARILPMKLQIKSCFPAILPIKHGNIGMLTSDRLLI